MSSAEVPGRKKAIRNLANSFTGDSAELHYCDGEWDEDFPLVGEPCNGPARLLVMSHLSILESADFLYLVRQTGLTRGNLSSQMRKLQDTGYVDIEKTFVDRLPRRSSA